MRADALQWRQERDRTARRKGNGASPPSAGFKLIDWNDIAFDASEQWLIEDVLPLRGLGLVFGKQGSFKSFVAMGLALAVMLGERWAGKRVKKGNILYLAAEGGPGMAKRIAPHKGQAQNSASPVRPRVDNAEPWRGRGRPSRARCRRRRR